MQVKVMSLLRTQVAPFWQGLMWQASHFVNRVSLEVPICVQEKEVNIWNGSSLLSELKLAKLNQCYVMDITIKK